MDKWDSLATLLNVLREEEEVTFSALSQRTGISASHLCEIANNRARPSLETLMRLAATYKGTFMMPLNAEGEVGFVRWTEIP